ncbi:MAG: sn-glycerol-3-phosphate ABC transporter ATP-binding protein UgpC [Rhodobacteraceae bacterium]|nr:sn-glycerol-3-phosphate ABC transporter ATP-binding protein UgpC [Paracoccaceae bacterium]
MSGVNLTNIIKKYGETQVIHGVDLSVEPGEFCVFVGPSGCGKSTLLRMIAGLEETSGGAIRIGSRDVTKLDPAQRGVAMVFQTYALYPHMSVAENMGFGLKMNGHPKDEIRQKVDRAADILKLGDYLHRKPKALSGGQRQRVAIGRAIVRGPEVFLFDEPLSNLDAELRVEMRVELARLHREIGATMIYVTHDQVEAMTLADKIVVLRGGRIEQVGAPLDLYRDPDNLFVAGFIGSPAMNLMPAHRVEGGLSVPALGAGVIAPPVPAHAGNDLVAGVRPQMIKVIEGNSHIVEMTEALGGVSFIHAATTGQQKLVVETRGDVTFPTGAAIALQTDPEGVYLFDRQSGHRLR